MKKSLAILLIFALQSCAKFGNKGVEIIITNNSNIPITNVECTTTEALEHITIEKIKPKDSISRFLSMQQNQTDGAYSLSFIQNKEEINIKSIGYYSNGNPFNEWIKFIVQKDTTNVIFSEPNK